jgi:hypothetical protein
MRHTLVFITVFFLSFASLSGYTAEMKNAIVVDSSGSMAGFYNTGSIRMLVVNLQKILGGADIYLFSDKGPEMVGRADSLNSINRDTRIDLAIQGFLKEPASRPDALWMITDNVQDRTETPFVDASTRDFYSILRQDDFQKILIMLCYLDFDGKVYVNREGSQYSVNYTGRKGLIIYGILMNKTVKAPVKKGVKPQEDPRKKQFDDLSARFANTLRAYESKLLLAKPLDKATFDLLPAGQIPNNEKANVTLNERGRYIGKGFKEGNKIPIVFYVKLLSKFEDLIVSGKVIASIADNQFTSIGFRDAHVACTIFPEKVNVDPGKTTETIYKVTINIEKVRMKLDPASILRAAFSGKPGTLESIVRLEVQVPREGFRFTNAVLNTYNTDDIQDFKKIYGMGSLINYMPADITSIPIEYRMILAVSYPHWPLVLMIILIIILVFLIYVLFRAVSSASAGKFAISVGGQGERITSLTPLIGTFSIFMASVSYGSIYKSFGGAIYAKAKKGFMIDNTLNKKRLNPEIDSFNVSDMEGVNRVDVNFRSLKKQEKIVEKRSDLDDGF